MSVDTERRKPAIAVLLGCAAALAVAAAAIWSGAVSFIGQNRLTEHGARVVATVTDTRYLQEQRGDSFEVRYAFQVADRPGTFTLGDGSGSNLWATTDGQQEWERAQATGHVDVLYLPEDPTVNRLITRRGNPRGDPAAGVVLGIMLAGASLFIGWLEATGRGQRWRTFLAQMRTSMSPRP
jgi:hypothetical protein